ncbi:MAG: hypothetical protein K9M82_08950 [Deltaproteobacteria bacterium]|nr:hypothetical protein [Deltaproteobacteria bacterium]
MRRKRFTTVSILAALAAGFALGLLAERGLDLFPPPARAAYRGQDQGATVSLDWEELSTNITRTIHRAPVPGGWIVAQQHGLAFVPDPDRAWKGKEESEGRF